MVQVQEGLSDESYPEWLEELPAEEAGSDVEDEKALVTRRCLKADCPQTFRVRSTSEQRYCSVQHDPNPDSKLNAIKARAKRQSAEQREIMKKMILEKMAANATREHMLEKLQAAGIKGSNGNRIEMKYLTNFMYFHGLSKNRRTRKPKPEEPTPEPVSTPKLAPQAGGRISTLVFSILTDDSLDDAEKIGLLRRYAGLD